MLNSIQELESKLIRPVYSLNRMSNSTKYRTSQLIKKKMTIKMRMTIIMRMTNNLKLNKNTTHPKTKN